MIDEPKPIESISNNNTALDNLRPLPKKRNESVNSKKSIKQPVYRTRSKSSFSQKRVEKCLCCYCVDKDNFNKDKGISWMTIAFLTM